MEAEIFSNIRCFFPFLGYNNKKLMNGGNAVKSYQINEANMKQFTQYLRGHGASTGTIEKYQRDIRSFGEWMKGRKVSPEKVTQWKEFLLEQDYGHSTINSMLAAVNAFFRFMGWDCRVKFLRVQRKIFCDPARELTRREYLRLVETAGRLRKERLSLLMETIGSTGIRVSEVPCITVEAAKKGKAEVSLKGKIRTIFLPQKLCRKLLCYAKNQKTASGGIFLTRNGKNLSRKQIWAEMKALCQKAGVMHEKVFPHNLRHLFARTFYKTSQDVVKLADVLGHSSIETTRIYLISSGTEHIGLMERLPLLL